MNDLAELKDAWGQPDPPSPTAHATARAALVDQIARAAAPRPAAMRPARRGVRLSWLIGGTSVVAAAAVAVAFAVVPGGTPPRPQDPTSSTPTRQYSEASGAQVLLAAADAAQSRPASTGLYWHVRSLLTDTEYGHGGAMEHWTTRDGDGYVLLPDKGGVYLMEPKSALSLAGQYMTADQLERLPSDPTALKAWIADSYAHPAPPPAIPGGPKPPMPAGGGNSTEAQLSGLIMNALIELLYNLPAPPAVRAAVLRALAAMPDVTNVGTKDGGQALRIAIPPPPADKFPNGKVPAGADGITLVIDTATSTLISYTNYQGTIKILTAEWTNEMPKIVPATKP